MPFVAIVRLLTCTAKVVDFFATMEDEIHALVIDQAGRYVQLEATGEDAGRRNEMLNSLALSRRILILHCARAPDLCHQPCPAIPAPQSADLSLSP